MNVLIYKNKDIALADVAPPLVGERKKLLEKAGFYKLLEKECGEAEAGFPLLTEQQFRDIAEVFPASYMYSFENYRQSRRDYTRKMGIEEISYGGVYGWDFDSFANYEFKEGIPSAVIQLISTVMIKQKLFQSVEIRTPEYHRAPIFVAGDPLLLGIAKTGSRFLLARWGSEEFMTYDEIKLIAGLRRRILPRLSDLNSPLRWFRKAKAMRMFPQYSAYFDGYRTT